MTHESETAKKNVVLEMSLLMFKNIGMRENFLDFFRFLLELLLFFVVVDLRMLLSFLFLICLVFFVLIYSIHHQTFLWIHSTGEYIVRLNDFSINWILQILHFPTAFFICTNYFTHLFCIWTSFPFMLRIAFLLKCSLHTSLIFFPSYHFIVDGSKDIKLSLNQIIVVSIALSVFWTVFTIIKLEL